MQMSSCIVGDLRWWVAQENVISPATASLPTDPWTNMPFSCFYRWKMIASRNLILSSAEAFEIEKFLEVSCGLPDNAKLQFVDLI